MDLGKSAIDRIERKNYIVQAHATNELEVGNALEKETTKATECLGPKYSKGERK